MKEGSKRIMGSRGIQSYSWIIITNIITKQSMRILLQSYNFDEISSLELRLAMRLSGKASSSRYEAQLSCKWMPQAFNHYRDQALLWVHYS